MVYCIQKVEKMSLNGGFPQNRTSAQGNGLFALATDILGGNRSVSVLNTIDGNAQQSDRPEIAWKMFVI